jgi:hypothetical protein
MEVMDCPPFIGKRALIMEQEDVKKLAPFTPPPPPSWILQAKFLSVTHQLREGAIIDILADKQCCEASSNDGNERSVI